MPRISGVRERGNKSKVFVDGEFWAEIDPGVAAERGVLEGAELSAEELREIREAGEGALAMNRALRFIGYRARSLHEVEGRLRRYGHSGEVIDGVVERLGELGYLDDEDFARTAAGEKARKYGPRRVFADLRRLGVAPDIAQEAVEEEFAGRSELEEARQAASRRYNTREGSDAQARRVYGFLMRRGYSASICAEVAREHRGARSPEAGK